MNELDENGWGHIHHAAFRGFIKSVERFVAAGEDQLELETGDDLHSTPLLLAVMSGNLETVTCLVNLGAKVSAMDSSNNGVIELCAFKQFIHLLEYFIELNNDKLPVWKNLVKFMSSDFDEESESASKCLYTLTKKLEDGEMNPNWRPAFDNGVVPAIVRVSKSSLGDGAKTEALRVLLNLCPVADVKEQAVSSGVLPALVKHVRSNTHALIQVAAENLSELSTVDDYADQAVHHGAITPLVRVMQTLREPEVLIEVVQALGSIAHGRPQHQKAVGSTSGLVDSILALFDECNKKPLLLALIRTIAKLVDVHEPNQTLFVDGGIAQHIIAVTRVKNKDLQLAAVQAIHRLVERNAYTSRSVLEQNAVPSLMQLLKKHEREPTMTERTASALWAIAGDDLDEQRTIAGLMGVSTLVDFLKARPDFEQLSLIGSECLGVLAHGPRNKQTAIANANGVGKLVSLLSSNKEQIVLSVVRTLRHLCVGVGYVPHARNQSALAHSNGIRYLVALMTHSRDEVIQVEAAHTLGCAALGHNDNLQEIQSNVDFSYVRVLKMLYSPLESVRIIAGSALAAFSYNSLHNQNEIAQQGGVRFACFEDFLKSDDEYSRCNVAFQVVVLARIIPDEEQAISSAAGIKLLSDLLADSRSDQILALTADCIARLAHTRAGVPAAFIAIDTVNQLCDQLRHHADQVRGCAAIALGYLSYNHEAQRQLLNRCRKDPHLMKVLVYYTSDGRLASEFLEGWKHYKQIGLPTVDDEPAALTDRKSIQYKVSPRQMTVTSAGGTTGDGSHVTRSSPTPAPALMDGIPESDRSKSSRSSHVSERSYSQSSVVEITPRTDAESESGSTVDIPAPPEVVVQEY
ncbi:hypothetical protein NP493_447g01012 [Ridgeia piscesae]|uniref:Uncharacterized protein n=1 Tax=Ridgeia piscesae TaxID=27915 RepID=A0AAD9KZA6_RIDPI|nr:hypothetical protein NP493_447g01012 [Ridgeia piscesae]